MNDSRRRNVRLAAVAMLLLAAAAWYAESSGWLTSLKLAAHNSLLPGRSVLLSLTGDPEQPRGQPHDWNEWASAETEQLQQALLENELQRRQLLIENARLNNQLRAAQRLMQVESVTDHELLQFSGQPATVLSHSGMNGVLRELIIAAGKSQDLIESELVVDGSGPVIDRGTDDGIQAGQKITVGAAVVGRIQTVARWVSLVQPVTHREFSAAVQLVRRSSTGASFGASGLLEGTGNSTCRLTGIPGTESVAVGDQVFSADIEGLQAPRLYFGEVTAAAFSSGGEWTIEVTPALSSLRLSEVTIVRPQLNSQRTVTGRSLPADRRSVHRTAP